LKTRTVDVPQAIRIAYGVMAGLAFLHDERQMEDGNWKPSIVHRDFKSRNVLIKSDLTACIADFGLALKCEHGSAGDNEEAFAQVGTRRYMAPEVLEGATEFSAFAFRQIDVYAAALVVWELLGRTKIAEDSVVGEAKLPFEDEVGSHPTLIEMQDCVLHQRKRPAVLREWQTHQSLKQMAATMEEMWEWEPDGRLTAGCAAERFRKILEPRASVFNLPPHQQQGIVPETVPLICNQSPEEVV